MYQSLDEALKDLYDFDPMVRWRVASYLGEIDDPRTIDALDILGKDANEGVRDKAKTSRLMKDPRNIDALIAMLHDTDESVRNNAASALVNINDEKAIQPLIDCFIDPKRKSTPDGDGDVSWHIPFCIKDFGPIAIPYIVPYLNNPFDAWKKSLLWLLYQMAEPSSVQPLIDAYKRCDKEDGVSKYTIQNALSVIDTPEAKAFLASLSKN